MTLPFTAIIIGESLCTQRVIRKHFLSSHIDLSSYEGTHPLLMEAIQKNIARGTTDPGYRVRNLRDLSAKIVPN